MRVDAADLVDHRLQMTIDGVFVERVDDRAVLDGAAAGAACKATALRSTGAPS